jgi:hypothetical protein
LGEKCQHCCTVRSMGTDKDMILDFGASRTVKTKGDGMELRQ